AGYVTADFKIFDDSGQLLAEIRGFKCRTLPQAGQADAGVGDAFYELRWRPAPRDLERVPAPMPFGRCLLFADDHGVAAKLAEDLEALGNTTVVVETAA